MYSQLCCNVCSYIVKKFVWVIKHRGNITHFNTVASHILIHYVNMKIAIICLSHRLFYTIGHKYRTYILYIDQTTITYSHPGKILIMIATNWLNQQRSKMCIYICKPLLFRCTYIIMYVYMTNVTLLHSPKCYINIQECCNK